MRARQNPVDDKTRSARKRYGPQAALWGLLTALYAAGRDEEARWLEIAIRGEERREVLEATLNEALTTLPDLGNTGEGLIGWAAHRYHLAQTSEVTWELLEIEDLLPRAAYPVMEWSQRARPRPNLFDMSIEEAYAKATAFLDSRGAQGPRQGPVVYRFDDGWTVQDLPTKELLVDEGNYQHICVGQVAHGYPKRVAAGEIKIYSLRDPEGKPHVTMTWSEKNKLYEASAAYNGPITSEDIRRRCASFGRSIGMSNGELLWASLIDGKGADLRNANLRGMSLKREDLQGANLSGADLSRVSMREANLSDANLSDANISEAWANYASLNNANLTGADLRETDCFSVDLRNADLTGANLERTNLISAKYNRSTKWPAGFDPLESGAILTED